VTSIFRTVGDPLSKSISRFGDAYQCLVFRSTKQV
jgi:hypothetical protein